jgi:hypothetical protein
MSEPSGHLGDALARLSAAVDLLDAAAMRRLAAEKSEQARAVELDLMRADRARLADQLDKAVARGRELETARHDAMERVDRAMALVKGVMAEREG